MTQKNTDLTAREAARLLGTHLLDVVKEINEGKLPARRDQDGYFRIRREDVAAAMVLKPFTRKAGFRQGPDGGAPSTAGGFHCGKGLVGLDEMRAQARRLKRRIRSAKRKGGSRSSVVGVLREMEAFIAVVEQAR